LGVEVDPTAEEYAWNAQYIQKKKGLGCAQGKRSKEKTSSGNLFLYRPWQ